MKVVTECPAKINRFLAVGPRDARGYHPLRTVFQAVSLSDTLTLTDGCNQTEVICNWPDLPKDNTITKAYRFLQEHFQLPPLRIELFKRIPAQSGLGGGSSDAAGFLRAVGPFLPTSIPERDLHDIALAVGADVPFFLVGGRAKAEGYGEILTPLEDNEEEWLIVARPDVDCPTAEMYAQLDKQQYEWRDWGDMEQPYNDFERVAPQPCRDLIDFLIDHGASQAMLSGSGSAVFGLMKNRDQAENELGSLERAGYRAWVLKTLKRKACLTLTSE